MRKILKVGEYHRIGTFWDCRHGVHLDEISWREPSEARGNWVALPALTLYGDAAALGVGRISALIHHHAISEGIGRHHAQRAVLFPLPEAFVVGKEEQPVLDDGPAHRRTENISDEFLRSVAFS